MPTLEREVSRLDPVCGGSLRQNSIADINRLACRRHAAAGDSNVVRLRLAASGLSTACDAVPGLQPSRSSCHADEGFGSLRASRATSRTGSCPQARVHMARHALGPQVPRPPGPAWCVRRVMIGQHSFQCYLTGRCSGSRAGELCCRRRRGASFGQAAEPGGERLPSRSLTHSSPGLGIGRGDLVRSVGDASPLRSEVRRTLKAIEGRVPASGACTTNAVKETSEASPALPGRPVRARPLPRVEEVFGACATGGDPRFRKTWPLPRPCAHSPGQRTLVARSRTLRPPPVGGSAVWKRPRLLLPREQYLPPLDRRPATDARGCTPTIREPIGRREIAAPRGG